MKKISVEIVSTAPLLMHSAEKMESQGMAKNPAKLYDHKAYAERVAYRKKSGELYIPSRAIKRCMINAAGFHRFGKQSAKKIIGGCVKIEPEEVGLGTKKYVIDKRPVVIQGRDRIIRARPRLDEWKTKFDIVYDDEVIKEPGVIFKILEDAGKRVGLLDNRPDKYGENGTFSIKRFSPPKKA